MYVCTCSCRVCSAGQFKLATCNKHAMDGRRGGIAWHNFVLIASLCRHWANITRCYGLAWMQFTRMFNSTHIMQHRKTMYIRMTITNDSVLLNRVLLTRRLDDSIFRTKHHTAYLSWGRHHWDSVQKFTIHVCVSSIAFSQFTWLNTTWTAQCTLHTPQCTRSYTGLWCRWSGTTKKRTSKNVRHKQNLSNKYSAVAWITSEDKTKFPLHFISPCVSR